MRHPVSNKSNSLFTVFRFNWKMFNWIQFRLNLLWFWVLLMLANIHKRKNRCLMNPFVRLMIIFNPRIYNIHTNQVNKRVRTSCWWLKIQLFGACEMWIYLNEFSNEFIDWIKSTVCRVFAMFAMLFCLLPNGTRPKTNQNNLFNVQCSMFNHHHWNELVWNVSSFFININ